MIVLADSEKNCEKLLSLCEKTAFGCKIAAIANAYGFEKGGANFWLDTDSDAVFCHSDDLMIISGTVLNADETRGFIKAVGPKSVMCAVRNAEALSLPILESGDVLKKQLGRTEAKPFDPYSVNIREIYTLLDEVGMVDEFEPFYLDFSHKLRHGGAFAATEHSGSGLVGCAVISSVSSSSAILSAVAVDDKFRRQGMGTALAKAVEGYCPDKTMYIFREKDKHQEFYSKLNYTKADTWVYSQL